MVITNVLASLMERQLASISKFVSYSRRKVAFSNFSRQAISIVLFTFISSVSSVVVADIPSEDDWWLPEWVEKSANSGDYGNSSYASTANTKISWKDIEPVEGQYDWSVLENALAAGDVFLRIFASDVIHVPAWLGEKYPDLKVHRFRWPNKPYYDVHTKTSSVGDFYEIWDPRFEAEFRQLMQSFRDHKLGSHPNMKFSYLMHGWRWNEWGVKWVPEMIQSGITVQDFIGWFQRTVDDYVYGFEGNAGKLLYTGTADAEWIEGGDSSWVAGINSADGGNVLSKYAVSAGAGARTGSSEWLDYGLVDNPDWGMSRKKIGSTWYQAVDDNHPFLKDSIRIFGAENECFASCGTPAGTDDYWHIKMATLKILQMRVNWVFLSQKAVNVAPDQQAYAFKTMGKTVYNTPDAWVALREAQDHRTGDGTWLQNWERWVYQREVAPEGLTTRVSSHSSPLSQVKTTYEARSTNHASGSDYIYFDVDDRFINKSRNADIGNIQVKVTYLDNFAGSWRIEYDADDGNAYKQSTAIQNSNDGQWKTVTVSISDAAFMNRQNGGMDLRLFNGGTQDLTVRFLRVIKLTQPLTTTIPGAEPVLQAPTGLQVELLGENI